MAKWKGPFTVTKVPNRFQIEYLDGSVTRLTHISYAKKYNERCQYPAPVGLPHQTRVSHLQRRVRMARLRLTAGTGRHRSRMVVSSLRVIREKWTVQPGRIRVQVLGDTKDLPSELRAIVEATGPGDYIEGSVLVDLCRQRSGQRGNGCDAPIAFEEFPAPLAPPPRPPPMLAGQVRQYSWHHYVKKENDIYDLRREFVGANRQTNRITPSLSQQAPLVSRSHLMAVVRKVERVERSKGKLLQDSLFKGLHKSQEKNVTSLLFSRQKPEGVSQHYSVIRDDDECSNSEMNQLVHAPQYANDKYPLKSAKAKKENEEVKFKRPGGTNDDGIKCDVMNHDNDVTIRDPDVNRLIARKRYAVRKQSPVRSKGIFKSSLNACNRTFTKIALPLIMVLCILGGWFNIKLPERKSTIGTSPSLPLLEPLSTSTSRAYWSLSNLREYTDANGDINEGLWSRIPQVISLNNNEQLIRCMKILQNTIYTMRPFALTAPYLIG